MLARMWPCREVLIVFVICVVDMISSAVLFHHNLAVEANPLLRPVAEAGMGPFILAKMMTFLPALIAAEWYARKRPEFVQNLLRFAGTAYVAIYSFFVTRQILG